MSIKEFFVNCLGLIKQILEKIFSVGYSSKTHTNTIKNCSIKGDGNSIIVNKIDIKK
jgi:hypothetical protein